MDYMILAAKQLFLEVNLLLDERTGTCAQMENEFFSSLRLSNGVHKITFARWWDDANKTLVAVFQKLSVAPRTFLDVAASSGVSTIERFESLQQTRLKPSMTATKVTLCG
jgi:hypothetical protein